MCFDPIWVQTSGSCYRWLKSNQGMFIDTNVNVNVNSKPKLPITTAQTYTLHGDTSYMNTFINVPIKNL